MKKAHEEVDLKVFAMGLAVAAKKAVEIGLDRESFHKVADTAYSSNARVEIVEEPK